MEDNVLMSKESMKDAISTIGDAEYTLIYDGNDTFEQKKAGRELRQAKLILAEISDHVYDYYPKSYFMNDDDKREFREFYEWFLNNPQLGIKNAIRYVDNNFCMLETVTRDELNQHRLPRRNLEKESHAKKILEFVADNLDEYISLLLGPKKVTDPSKPTEIEIKKLIEAISNIQKSYSDYADKKGDNDFVLQVFQFNKMLEMYKLPLLMAWQVYKYGDHTDFWKEGDSMFEYMMFELKAKEMMADLVTSLESDSPFKQMERNSLITNGLLHVYRHLLQQDLSNL